MIIELVTECQQLDQEALDQTTTIMNLEHHVVNLERQLAAGKRISLLAIQQKQNLRNELYAEKAAHRTDNIQLDAEIMNLQKKLDAVQVDTTEVHSTGEGDDWEVVEKV